MLGNQTTGPKRKGSQLLYVAEKEDEQFTEQGHISKTQQGVLERNRSRREMKHSRARGGWEDGLLLVKEEKSLRVDNSKAEERQGAGGRGTQLDPEGNKI